MKKNKRITIIQIILLIAAVIAFLFPVAKSIYFQNNNSKIISEFENTEAKNQVQDMKDKNEEITDENFYTVDPFTETEVTYIDTPVNVIGVLNIPKINEELAVYDRTTQNVLAQGVGMLEGTHYPTGELNQTTALTGHNGTYSATIFQRLKELDNGDYFTFDNGEELLTFEVYETMVVLPEDTNMVQNTVNQNTMILLTCITPDMTKGLNTHRLLVYGKKVDNIEVLEETNSLMDFVKKNFKFIVLGLMSTGLMTYLLRLILLPIMRNKKEFDIIPLKKLAINFYLMYLQYQDDTDNLNELKTDLELSRQIIQDYISLGWERIFLNEEKDNEIFINSEESEKEIVSKFHLLKIELDNNIATNKEFLNMYYDDPRKEIDDEKNGEQLVKILK